jgi:hypothetical protein
MGKPAEPRTYTRVCYQLWIEWEDKWLEGAGDERSDELILNKIELGLGSAAAYERGRVTKFKRTKRG